MKILIVEDDESQAALVAHTLRQSDPPLDSVIVRSLSEVSEVEATECDAVLLDLNLPDSRSLETVIRARTLTPAPIVVFSGESGLGEAAIRAGADDYLIKGIAPPRAVHRSLVYAIGRRDWAQQSAERADALANVEGELRRSEARLRAIFDNEPECVKIVSSDGRLLFMNPSGLNMLEVERFDDIANQQVSQFVHPEDRAAFIALHRAVVEGGNGQLQFRICGASGRERWMETHSVPLPDEEVGTVSVLSVTRDITSRRMAEQSLRRSEALLQIASRIGRVGAWRVELPSQAITWSSEVRSIHEVAEDFAPDMPTGLAFYPAQYRDRIAAAIRECMEGGAAFDLEAQIVTARGKHVWVRVIGEAERDSEGAILAIIGAFQDITVPKEAAERARMNEQARAVLEAALAHERGRLVEVFRKAPSFMCVLRGPSHVFEYANDAYFDLVGWRPIVGKPAAQALPEVVDQGFIRLLDQAYETGRPIVSNSTPIMLRREGAPEERCVDFIYQPLVEADGNVSGILVQGTDVTEKRRLEQRFFRVQRMESIGALAGGIAHDLNNLLMPIMMGANLLRRPATEEQRERAIRMIEQSAQRGSDFVNQILQFVRGVEAERRPVQVGDVLRELELMIDRTFPASVALDIDIEEDLWWIDGDATQLHQVLLNLCVNARDAMPLGGRLSIAASNAEVDLQYSLMHRGLVAGPYVRITVADTGVGIEPHVVEKMFDPFFTTRENEQGTGLGLSTVAAIVRRHGGTITVQSRPGKGSVFAVYLPVRTDVPVQQPAGPAAAVGRGAGELILVVDDDPAILAVMRETLEADGYRVATADDGARAVTVFAERRDEVALVLTDLQMPVVTGAMLTSALRRIDPSVRVIVSSGALAGDSAPEADAVLHKPYSSDELLSAVAAVLGSGLRASG